MEGAEQTQTQKGVSLDAIRCGINDSVAMLCNKVQALADENAQLKNQIAALQKQKPAEATKPNRKNKK